MVSAVTAGAEGHGAATLSGLRALHELLQDKHDGGRGHVAEARRMLREAERASAGRSRPCSTASRMVRPPG